MSPCTRIYRFDQPLKQGDCWGLLLWGSVLVWFCVFAPAVFLMLGSMGPCENRVAPRLQNVRDMQHVQAAAVAATCMEFMGTANPIKQIGIGL